MHGLLSLERDAPLWPIGPGRWRICRGSARDSPGLILNQIEYMAGRKTSVSTVPASVPPISV